MDAAREVVLVHGAFHGAWCWVPVRSALGRSGVRTHAVDLPFTGFDDDVAEVRRALEQAGNGVVVCGHSYGGRVISAAVDGLGSVDHLVYVAAHMMEPNVARRFVNEAGYRERRRFHDFDAAYVRERFYADCPDDLVRLALARLRPTPEEADEWRGFESLPWLRIPSTYVVCRDDNALPAEAQRRMARQARFAFEMRTGHSPFFAAPELLAELLRTIVVDGTPRVPADGSGISVF